MKSGRSGRLSKKSATMASIRNTLKDIPGIKMSEILNEEHRDLIIFQIREDLMDSVLDKCYELYLEKQSVLFTGYCAYLAWKQLFQWAFFPRDPGETDYTDSTKWVPDKPPEPSPRDTWAGYSMPIIEKPKVENKYAHVTEHELTDPCEIYKEPPKAATQKLDTRNRRSNILKEGPLPEEKSKLLDASPIKKKKKSVKSVSSIQRYHDASMFTKIKTMSFKKLPTAPPPQVDLPSEVSTCQQTFDETQREQLLIDPTVSAPRKLHHEALGPFRVPISYQVLDEKDECLDMETNKKKSKRIIAREIKKYSKPKCPNISSDQKREIEEEQLSKSSVSSNEVKMIFDESVNQEEFP